MDFAQAVGGIQLDSINIIDRAHYLTLWSRFGAYDRARLDRLVYEERVLFEYWSHVACLVATADLKAWRRAMTDYSTRNKAWGAWLRTHRPMLRLVEEQIRQRGPLGNADFVQKRKGKGGWWNWKPATHALDYLWMSGVIGTHSRRHFHKRFDLTERLVPDALRDEPLSKADFLHWHLHRSLSAMGAATETDLRMYMTFPREPASARKARLVAAVKRGEVCEVRVDGLRNAWYVLAQDMDALAAASSTPAPSQGTTFLSPFDSLLWHRERVEALFSFNYRIEVYVPGPKRHFGYYVLPLLHDGRFIGRADFKTHRKERTLEVRALHFEPWFARGHAPPHEVWGPVDRDAALAGTAQALRSLAAFVGAEEVNVTKVSPTKLVTGVRQALRKSPPIAPQRAAEDDEESDE